jgi:hypothetical protein
MSESMKKQLLEESKKAKKQFPLSHNYKNSNYLEQ